MSSDNGNEVIFGKEAVCRIDPEEPAAASDLIASPATFEITIVLLDWITPQDVTEKAHLWWLMEPVDLLDVFQLTILLIVELV
jgi:hypothetical protein